MSDPTATSSADSAPPAAPDARSTPVSGPVPAPVSAAGPGNGAYRVLARKYRPQTFAGLIGQDALVRTLSNAIAGDRLAHAWLLTGVRGVGKTTTARIIARALNCVGPDGNGGPTAEPCGVCPNCVTIAEGRHPDVLEMDAASRTGVEDIRELIEGVRYRPTSARYKIYIIDEVHMLSNNAFNALLKTLEEPPEHVKFVFATTESRKVPVTVLSRCQRFDLRRIDEDMLTRHFAAIAEAEGVELEPAALRLIARAADGSVRDGLSILDQAIASAASEGGADGAGPGTPISEEAVRAMLGLADRTQVFELFESVMTGDIGAALDRLAVQHGAGVDAESVMNDLLELTHWLTRVKITPALADDPVVPEAERVIGRRLADGLAMPVLARCWQMLLKGLAEVQAAPQPMKAAEMVLVRLAYASDLPSPADLVARLQKEGVSRPPAPGGSGAGAGSPAGAGPSAAAPSRAGLSPAEGRTASPSPPGGERMQAASGGARPQEMRLSDSEPSPSADMSVPSPQAKSQSEPAAESGPTLPSGFEAAVALLDKAREGRLAAELRTQAHLVRFEPGHIEFRPAANADRTLANRLGTRLRELTGIRWTISLSRDEGEPTLAEQAMSRDEERKRAAATHPLVQAALAAFPGASIATVREPVPEPPMDAGADLPEDDTSDPGFDPESGPDFEEMDP